MDMDKVARAPGAAMVPLSHDAALVALEDGVDKLADSARRLEDRLLPILRYGDEPLPGPPEFVPASPAADRLAAQIARLDTIFHRLAIVTARVDLPEAFSGNEAVPLKTLGRFA